MENNVACKIVGIGDINVNMYNGAVHTLKNVRHVLDLKKNLIYLRALNKKEHKFFCDEEGTLKVTKGDRLFLKG